MSVSSSDDSSPLSVQTLNIQHKKKVFGIDFGTTRTRVAIVKFHEDDPSKAEYELVTDIPSVVSYTNNFKCLVGPCAETRIISSARHTFHSTKCFISRSYDDPVVREFAKKIGYDILRLPDGQACVMSTNSNQILTSGHIATLIFLKVKELCQIKLKEPMENVVITIPDHFTENQIQTTQEAAQMAGLNVLKMISESIVAIFAYNANEIDDKNFFIYDFGGTFKVTVLEIRNGKLEVKSTVHDLFLGGGNFDDVLIKYFVKNLKRMTGFDVSENLITIKWLKTAAQNVQIDLCYATEIEIFFYCINFRKKHTRISIKLTRSEFEELVAEFINKTIPLCHKALEDANVAVSEIDEVFAIGGISRIPKVRATLQEIFNKIPQPSENGCDRVNSLAFGAAAIGLNVDDAIAYAQVPPQFLKPAEETEEFDYHLADDLHDGNFMDKLCKQITTTGIVVILTEEEVDDAIMHRYQFSPNLNKEGDVNFIPDYHKLLRIRRRNPEVEISDELQIQFEIFRKRRNNFVIQELSSQYNFEK